MYKSKDFMLSGSAVYGLIGALLGAIVGLVASAAIAIPAAAFALLEPVAGVLPLVLVPLAITLGAFLGGTVGALLGLVRGALISNALSAGRGWLVLILALVLAVFFSDIVSGLALFLIWRKFRAYDPAQLAHHKFWRLAGAYVFAYGLLFFGLGLLLGSGLGGLVASSLGAQTNNLDSANELVVWLAQFLNSISLQASLDTAKGGLDAGLNAIISQDLNSISFDSYANISIAGEQALKYSASLASEVENFVQNIKGNTAWVQDGIQWSYSFSNEAVEYFLRQREPTLDLVSGMVNGGMLGASQGFVYGFVFAVIFALMDHMVLKLALARGGPGIYVAPAPRFSAAAAADAADSRAFEEEMQKLERQAAKIRKAKSRG